MFHVALTLVFFVLINLLFWRFRPLQLKGFKPWVTVLLFNAKFATGIFIWAIYTFYYKDVQNNDVHKFYNDALILNTAAHQDPSAFVDLLFGVQNDAVEKYTGQMKNWQRNFDEAPVNENRTIIKLNALLMFVSFKTYFVHILLMCLLSLVGWVLAFNGIFNYIQKPPTRIALVMLLLPSVLFWTSGVMKEPVMVLGLGLFLHGLLLPQQTSVQSAKAGMWLAIGILILLMIKFYVLACLTPAAFTFIVFKRKESLRVALVKYGAFYFLMLIMAFNIQKVLPPINPMQMIANKQQHSVLEAEYFKAGSRISISKIEPSAFSILTAVPVGIWNIIVRPYPWETRNPLMIASALENVLVLALLLWLIRAAIKGRKVNFNQQGNYNLFFFLLLFSVSYFALIGICTPVLGNLVRYKAPVTPFFMWAFVCLG